MSTNVIPFPITPSDCSGCTIPGITQPELRRNAWNNFYTECRHKHIDPLTAHDLADAFMADLERVAQIMGVSA